MLWVLLLAIGLSAGPVPASAAGKAPAVLPEGLFTYAVLRHGDTIGSLTVDSRRSGGALVVRSHMEILVSFLSIPLYRFRHDAEERWVDGRLAALTSRTNDDGDMRRVELRREGGRLRGTYNGKARDLPGDLLPANLWNPEAVSRSVLLDPIKGRPREIAVADRGEERIRTGAGLVAAHHYAITGEMTRDVWYGADGKLLQMRFPAKDGSEITLVLEGQSPVDGAS